MICEFDLNHFASTDLNQLYATDFDFKTRRVAVYLETHCNIGSKKAFSARRPTRKVTQL